ncbi:MAG: hypothetical protein IKN48_05885 [Bacteroidaceae bacterium]|nr:hypothetical protein [Bacteroidaceae bacterium]
MAIVSKVITPHFYSEKEPYMIVLFVEESENQTVNKFKIATLSTPRYLTIYDVRKLYPELTTYEAVIRFKEEMKVGNHEPINLHTFKISDLTDGEHLYIRSSSVYGKETDLRVAIYDIFDKRETAKKILAFCIKHQIFAWSY